MVDKAKVEEAIKLLLEGIGEDVNREGLQGTPERIARMCEEIYGGLDNEADEYLQKQFHVENNEMVLEKILPFIPCANIILCRFPTQTCLFQTGILLNLKKFINSKR